MAIKCLAHISDLHNRKISLGAKTLLDAALHPFSRMLEFPEHNNCLNASMQINVNQ